jgi:hypothetical protein
MSKLEELRGFFGWGLVCRRVVSGKKLEMVSLLACVQKSRPVHSPTASLELCKLQSHSFVVIGLKYKSRSDVGQQQPVFLLES